MKGYLIHFEQIQSIVSLLAKVLDADIRFEYGTKYIHMRYVFCLSSVARLRQVLSRFMLNHYWQMETKDCIHANNTVY